LGGRDAVGFRLGEVSLELSRHLFGQKVRDTEALPLPPALLDVRRHHATPASLVDNTESTSPRTSRQARTPSASARRPLGEARRYWRGGPPSLAARCVATRPSRSSRPSSG